MAELTTKKLQDFRVPHTFRDWPEIMNSRWGPALRFLEKQHHERLSRDDWKDYCEGAYSAAEVLMMCLYKTGKKPPNATHITDKGSVVLEWYKTDGIYRLEVFSYDEIVESTLRY